jgi:hypothetical protein
MTNRLTNWIVRAAATFALAGAMLSLSASSMFGVQAAGQDETAKALAARSAIVVAGKVVRVGASLEPMQPASAQTVVIMVSRMYSGAEIAGDQKGHTATVVLSRPTAGLKVGTEALFFGNPRFIGKSLTIASEGELVSGAANAASPASATANDVSLGAQTRRDEPIRERLAAASSVFRGRVESERALGAAAGAAAAQPQPPSEHDPEWHVATVRVTTAMQNATEGSVVTIMFPASRDIMWYSAPKLTPGQDAIFITHKADRDDVNLMRAPAVAAFLERQPVEVVSQPYDTLPVADEARVRALVARVR